jgi:3-hydroxybutyryl-CoA dehydrogenase
MPVIGVIRVSNNVIRIMQIVVLSGNGLKEELLNQGVQPQAEPVWIEHPEAFLNYPQASACIDLLFENTKERLRILNQIACPVVINSVVHTLEETNPSFIRINGWNTFLKSNLIEAHSPEERRAIAESILAQFNRQVQWLDDEPGFITPRVISMIINEAFISLEEGVSTKEEINKAMKLGTNYPYGPFEWAEKIGLKNICTLLQKLSDKEKRYQPSALIQQAG